MTATAWADDCCHCGRDRAEGYRQCPGCLAARRRYLRKQKAAGRCDCGRERVLGGRQCPACRGRHAARAAAHLAAGRCRCGRPPKPGCKSCVRCIRKAGRFNLARRQP